MDVKKWWFEPYDSRFRGILEWKLNEYIHWPSGLELTDDAVRMVSECSLAYKSEEYQTLVSETVAHNLSCTLKLQATPFRPKCRPFKVSAKIIMDAIGQADWEINKKM
jgi:hypothetical protein